jgi:hypothetical protein
LRRRGSAVTAEHRFELARFELGQVRGQGVHDGPGQRDRADTRRCLGRGEERRSTLDCDQLLFDSQLAAKKIETGNRECPWPV